MRRLAAILALVLGLTLLAAPPASAAASLQVENRASGSAAGLTTLIEIETRLSERSVRENIALGYDIASDDAVAARGVTEVTVATTKGARYANLAANIGAKEFQSNLIGNGYKIVRQTVGTNGPVTIMSNGTKTYTIYTATSTGELSAQLTNAAGEILSKIRLAGP